MLRKIFMSFLINTMYIGSVFASTNNSTNKIQVVASFSILANIVENIGGNKISVISLVGADQDAHEYSLKPSDLRNINNSKLLIINGLGLEGGWINNLSKQDDYKGTIVVASNGVKSIAMQDNTHDGHNHEQDPHIWGSPNLVAKYYVPNIESALISVDPKNKKYYQENARLYLEKLSNLNKWVIKQLDTIPVKQRIAVTTHDAFAYMAHAYKINFIFAQGVSTDSDASAKDIAKLIATIKTNKVKAVFLENMTNNQLIKQIAKDTGAKIGGELYSDALSNNTAPANNYISLVKYNINTMVKAWK
jgi:zinc/manganese transport system substrate-binding protein